MLIELVRILKNLTQDFVENSDARIPVKFDDIPLCN